MAVNGRIPIRQDDVFPIPLILMGVSPELNFDAPMSAPDRQQRDKQTNMRMWVGSCIDPSAQPGQHESKIKIAADVQPVPPVTVGTSGVQFDQLEVVPYVKGGNDSGEAQRFDSDARPQSKP